MKEVYLKHSEILLARDVGYHNIRGDREFMPLTDEDYELYHSIKTVGIKNALTVVPFKDNYLLLNGEGRYVMSQYALNNDVFPPGKYAEDDQYALLLRCEVDESLADCTLSEYLKYQWHHNTQTAIRPIKRIEFLLGVSETMNSQEIIKNFGVSGAQLSQSLKVGKSNLWPLVKEALLGPTVALEILRKATILERDPYDLYETLQGVYGDIIKVRDVQDYHPDDEDHRPDFNVSGAPGFVPSPTAQTFSYGGGGNGPTFGGRGNADELSEEEGGNAPDPSTATELPKITAPVVEYGGYKELSDAKVIKDPQQMYRFLEEIEDLDPMWLTFYNIICQGLQGTFTDQQLKVEINKLIN